MYSELFEDPNKNRKKNKKIFGGVKNPPYICKRKTN